MQIANYKMQIVELEEEAGTAEPNDVTLTDRVTPEPEPEGEPNIDEQIKAIF